MQNEAKREENKEIKNVDPRLRRTLNVLEQALIDLSVEKGFANITVRDLCARAMVNRSTFYRHYLDKFDMLERFTQEVYELVSSEEEEFVVAEQQPSASPPPRGMITLLEHVQENADFYRVMLGERGDPAFTQKVREYIEKRLRSVISTTVEPCDPTLPPLDLGLGYTAQAAIGALLWWLENKQPCTPEQLAIWLKNYAQADISLSFALDKTLAMQR